MGHVFRYTYLGTYLSIHCNCKYVSSSSSLIFALFFFLLIQWGGVFFSIFMRYMAGFFLPFLFFEFAFLYILYSSIFEFYIRLRILVPRLNISCSIAIGVPVNVSYTRSRWWFGILNNMVIGPNWSLCFVPARYILSFVCMSYKIRRHMI
ncbi:hypothetical protein DFH27DRAFT_331520 [Peziza echinospora]|nr:hypothetical protein DFH27DRAFT_331520 [Peziza echinospora]